MRKSLGSKRNEMDETDIAMVTRAFGDFTAIEARELDKPAEQKSNRGRQSANPKAEVVKTFASKIFNTYEFGYRRITIERPLRESYQFSDERIEELRFATGALNAAMKSMYTEFGDALTAPEEIRKHLKIHFPDFKEKQIKDLLEPKTCKTKESCYQKQATANLIGIAQHNDMNAFENASKSLVKSRRYLRHQEKKQLKDAVSWRNPAAEKSSKNHKTKANPLYGLFEVNGDIIEYQADSELRDNENVALDPSKTVNDINEAYSAKKYCARSRCVD